MIHILDASEVVSFLICALKIRRLSKITPRRQGVVLTRTFRLPMKIDGFQELSLDQVEKGHTSLFSAFKFNFHSWLQVATEFTTDWAVDSDEILDWILNNDLHILNNGSATQTSRITGNDSTPRHLPLWESLVRKIIMEISRAYR